MHKFIELDKRPPSVQKKYLDDSGALDLDKYEEVMAAIDHRNENIRKLIVREFEATIFRNNDASLFYSITSAANDNKKFQVTVWDKYGALSDSKHDSAEEIIRHYGYGSEFSIDATEQEFNSFLSGFFT
jgi:hypothetical protein